MMAKPKHGRCGNNHPLPCSPHLKRSRPPSPSPSPSPAILSALALIAATPPVVAGGPLPYPTPPPTFLCPLIERDTIDPDHDSLARSSPTPTSRHANREVIADRYVQGSDNLWRKTNAWTLYGLTCCSDSTATPSATHSHRASHTPMPTNSLTTDEFDTSILPAGWDSATRSSSNTTESTIILALAIALAGSICIFMAGCVLWRRRKKKAKDIERKFGHKLGSDGSVQDGTGERDSQSKMRMWAKASARWKSNIRQSARRRRRKQVSAIAPPVLSRRDSFTSEKPDSRSRANLSLEPEPLASLHIPHLASPPTYGASLAPSLSTSTASHSNLIPSPDDLCGVEHTPFAEGEPHYTPPPDGHVATDDKAQLAHLQTLASSPMSDAASASASQPVSAPHWHEMDGTDPDMDLNQVPMSFYHLGLPPFFPPPPTTDDVPCEYWSDYSLNCGDENTSSVPGPSPSAPPVDHDLGLEPSAPSLESEDDVFQGWDATSSFASDTCTLSDLVSVPTHTTDSSVTRTVSHGSFPSVRGSATRDGILPRYHP